MFCTLEEAGLKWCPFVRISTGSIQPSNSRGEDKVCLADRCMAWIKKSDVTGYCGLVRRVNVG